MNKEFLANELKLMRDGYKQNPPKKLLKDNVFDTEMEKKEKWNNEYQEMRVEYEYKEKLCEYFSHEIFKHESEKLRYAMSNMSIFSISTKYIWIDKKETFYNYVAKIFQRFIFQNLYLEKDIPCDILQSHTPKNNLECFHQYNLYIMIVRKMENPKSRVENYYRLWKRIEKDLEIKLDKFNLGKEIRADIGEKSYWYGVLKIPLEELAFAFKISERIRSCIIFLSRDRILEDSQNTINMFYQIFNGQYNGYEEYNLFQLITRCYEKNEYCIRFFDNLDELSIAFIYNPQNITLNFKKYFLK